MIDVHIGGHLYLKDMLREIKLFVLIMVCNLIVKVIAQKPQLKR